MGAELGVGGGGVLLMTSGHRWAGRPNAEEAPRKRSEFRIETQQKAAHSLTRQTEEEERPPHGSTETL